MSQTSFPPWSGKIRQSYLSGGASVFILHGNVADIVGQPDNGRYTVEPLADFLARRLFGSYDLVLHYDMGRGLRVYAGNDPQRFTKMNALAGRLLGDLSAMPRDPMQCLRLIDRLISMILVGQENRSRKAAVLFDYADMICSAEDRGGEVLATLLNWARSPVIRRVNIIFVLMTESLARMHPTLVQSGYTQEILLPLPDEDERKTFIRNVFPRYTWDADRLAVMTAGLTLANIDHFMRLIEPDTAPASAPARESEVVEKAVADSGHASQPTVPTVEQAAPAVLASDVRLTAIKKDLMEAQCPGLIEFVAPSFDLTMVAGHTAAKDRLQSDARLIREGRLGAVPMGYLLCGPVGVGKTFLAQCYAGAVGIPCITIRNFRSKYVGETEANLERILTVVRALGPVAVIVDEADAALGNRGASGDSGTSARVFAQLASQMGNTAYRGKIIWFLLTCRPDLLPIDLKRQGRCEEHIPLFYPQTPDELRDMFAAMARKAQIDLPADALPGLEGLPPLSGADIESILMRARRESLLRNQGVDAALIMDVLKNFRSARGLSHEVQILAATLECSDLRYLPQNIREKIEQPGAFEAFERRLNQLKALESEPME